MNKEKELEKTEWTWEEVLFLSVALIGWIATSIILW
jgi:hypothetical protein